MPKKKTVNKKISSASKTSVSKKKATAGGAPARKGLRPKGGIMS